MPRHEDAALVVQLAQWGTAMGLEASTAAIFADDFDPEAVTAQDADVRRVLQFGETIGTLTKNGVLNQRLVLDWLWVAGLWSRVGPAARRERERFGVAALFENFEALAAAQEG